MQHDRDDEEELFTLPAVIYERRRVNLAKNLVSAAVSTSALDAPER